MPPALFIMLSYPFTQLAHAIFPTAVANGIITGAYTFCTCTSPQTLTVPFLIQSAVDILYDCMHYAYVLILVVIWIVTHSLIASIIVVCPLTCVR